MWVNYLLQRENNSFNPREPQKILTLVSLPFTFFLSSVKLSTTSMTSAKGTTHKPDCGVKVNPSQCNGSQQFSNMVVLCFLGIFSKSFCGNQSQMFRNSFRCCFVCVCLGVHCTHSLKKRQKCISFLIKRSFNKIIICQVVCLNCIHMSTSLNGSVLYLIWLHFLKTYHLA